MLVVVALHVPRKPKKVLFFFYEGVAVVRQFRLHDSFTNLRIFCLRIYLYDELPTASQILCMLLAPPGGTAGKLREGEGQAGRDDARSTPDTCKRYVHRDASNVPVIYTQGAHAGLIRSYNVLFSFLHL